MQQELNATTLSDAGKREHEHAKLLSCDGRQILAYLYRTEENELAVILQLWVARTDEQLRAQINTQSDELTMGMFEALNEESIELVLHELGIPAMLADIEGRY